MTTGKTPRMPPNLNAGGKKMWRSVVEDYDLGPHELTLLLQVVRAVDALDALESVVRAEGVTVTTPQGVKAHPALVESRMQAITLAKLVASLRLPLEEDEEAGRTVQRRVGVRVLKAV
ncbi:terminase [Paeniglutamicibacter sp.]|uniref:terminase n=1 Tax=Paeniglutamicibacter sp. TaxID=1934391 RepID=UPI00398A08BB